MSKLRSENNILLSGVPWKRSSSFFCFGF